jgi:replication factor A1
MQIKDLKDGMKGKEVDVMGVIIEAQDPREVTIKATGEKRKVQHFTLKDASGSITLVLWEADCDLVKKDSIVAIQNGMVTQWNGNLQLNKGKFGKMTIQ